jgi:hypothetical protein
METIEEFAKKYAEKNQYNLEYYDEGGYQGIDENSFAKTLIDFATKWQEKRMYSEEEVLNILHNYRNHFGLFKNIEVLPIPFF